MGYLILALILIFTVPCHLEEKIRDHYGIQKRTMKNRFVNKVHIFLLASSLLITVFLVSGIVDRFRESWIIVIFVAFCIDMFFELRYRKEAKIYMLEVFRFSMIALIYISVSVYLR